MCIIAMYKYVRKSIFVFPERIIGEGGPVSDIVMHGKDRNRTRFYLDF